MKSPHHSLPDTLRPLFWDLDFASLEWETDRDFIVRRILQNGAWPAIRWLRSTCGDEALRVWLEAHAGGRLDPRRLRYWELALDLPAEEVDAWLTHAKNSIWENRIGR